MVAYRSYIVVDKTKTGYAAAITELETQLQAEFGATAVLGKKICAHDSDYEVIKINVRNADRAGDLALLERSTMDSAPSLLRHEYYDTDEVGIHEFQLRGFNILGKSSRGLDTQIDAANRPAYYYRRKTRQPTGTAAGPGYGKKNGLTYTDSFDGFAAPEIGATFASGATHTWCNGIVRERVIVNSNHFAESMKSFPVGDFTNTPIILRMDYPYAPGMYVQLLDYNVDGFGGGRNWNADTTPNVWFRIGGGSNGQAAFFVDPVKKTSDLITQNLLLNVTSIEEVRATPWSWWKEDATNLAWVHIPTGENPRFKLGWRNPTGVDDFASALNDTIVRNKGIKLINCQFVFASQSGGGLLSEAEWLGGRYLLGSSWFPNGIGPTTKIGWSTNGEILFDVSDRPDPDVDEYILKTKAKGSDPAGWARMQRWIECCVNGSGFYEFGGLGTPVEGMTIEGFLCTKCGTYKDLARNINFEASDGHCIGAQGNYGWRVRYIYLDKGIGTNLTKGAWEYYNITDPNNAQSIWNNIGEDFVVLHHNIAASGQGGSWKRTNGTGRFDGNIYRRGCIAEGEALFFNLPEVVLIQNVHSLRAVNCVVGENNTDRCFGAPNGQNPLTGPLNGVCWQFENCTFEDWTGQIFHMRQTGWHQTPKNIVSITKGNPTIVTVTNHGFPQFPGTPIIAPDVYFRDMVGMPELNNKVYKAIWISANSFSLSIHDGTPGGTALDSTSFGTFVSGRCGRAVDGYVAMINTTYIKAGLTINTTGITRYANNTSFSLAGLATFDYLSGSAPRLDLPGGALTRFDQNPTINP